MSLQTERRIFLPAAIAACWGLLPVWQRIGGGGNTLLARVSPAAGGSATPLSLATVCLPVTITVTRDMVQVGSHITRAT